jgi:hypothetical protein
MMFPIVQRNERAAVAQILHEYPKRQNFLPGLNHELLLMRRIRAHLAQVPLRGEGDPSLFSRGLA